MDLQQVAELCKVLSDPHRIRIMKLLVDGEKCASELLEGFSISQPTLSHHMKAMTDSGLLTERKEGKRTYYGINRRTWDEFMLVLDTISNETYWDGVFPRAQVQVSQESAPAQAAPAPAVEEPAAQKEAPAAQDLPAVDAPVPAVESPKNAPAAKAAPKKTVKRKTTAKTEK